jgi:hypothetical protein
VEHCALHCSLDHNDLKGGSFCVSLNHILSHYDDSRSFYRRSLLRHTLFAQSLLENPDLLHSRISALHKNTAFMSLGRYALCDCGRFVGSYSSLLADSLSEMPMAKSDISLACGRYIPCLEASYVLAVANW